MIFCCKNIRRLSNTIPVLGQSPGVLQQSGERRSKAVGSGSRESFPRDRSINSSVQGTVVFDRTRFHEGPEASLLSVLPRVSAGVLQDMDKASPGAQEKTATMDGFPLHTLPHPDTGCVKICR